MNKKAVIAVAKKDIKAITSNIQVWLPMIIVPVVFAIVIPIIIIMAGRFGNIETSEDFRSIIQMLDRIPSGSLKDILNTFPHMNQKITYLAANYFFAPLFLLIPVMCSSVISANSFVGEKERKTLESLLFTPISIKSLFAGKLLASFIPSMMLSLMTFLLYGLIVNIFGLPLLGRIIFPNRDWIILLFLVTPAVVLLSILINIFISSKVKTFQAANQLGGLIALPFIGLMISQFAGVLLISSKVMLIIGVALIVVDFILLSMITTFNDREKLFESQIE